MRIIDIYRAQNWRLYAEPGYTCWVLGGKRHSTVYAVGPVRFTIVWSKRYD